MRKSESLDSSFSTVRTEGGLLPADILAKILAGDSALSGTSPDAYHLPKGEKLNEAINRSWTRVRALWEKYRLQCEALDPADTGTTQTRETLLLPLFVELGYGRLFGAKVEERTVGDKVFSISHFWNHSPIHLIGCKVDLDKKSSGVRGAAQSSPHSMVQDFLNRSEAHLWGFCSNGLRLRILRDNESLSRQAFIEFDLESMFEGEVFSDFALLWLLCHQSRVESDNPSACWLEQWARSAQDQGVRALETLRGSVQNTIEILGQGFLESHNPDLKERLRSGVLSRQDYFRQLLRLVYRLLFLFAAEDRGLLHAGSVPEDVKKRYLAWHSTTRLRRLAGNLSGTRHHDLYEGLKLLMGYLGNEEGCPALGLSPLGSFLWAADALPDVHSARLSNGHLLHAVRALAYTETEGIRRPVDYKNVGARELGSIYESLLELHPVLDTVSGAFSLETASGNERKTTGSYYTPTPLIESLLDSALEPVVKQAITQENPEGALLGLKICDPACGSGHFLIAAAHRLAKRLAGVRTGDEEPGPNAVRKALRDVIGRCIYGVDINPMAVELCKVSLWLEALDPGKPLSFLDHHIRCGNSLIGATPELISTGLPDEAFKAIEGDEKTACTALKKRNKSAQKKAKFTLLAQQEDEVQKRLRAAASALESIPSDSMKDIHAKENAFRLHESMPEFQSKLTLAHSWCAAFVIRKYFPPKSGHPTLSADEPVGITQWELNSLGMGQALQPELALEVEMLAEQYQFFHWYLAYPEVFARGGFDVILGNPPWEQLEQQEGNERDKTISGAQHFIEKSKRYPLTGNGRKNLYGLFAELVSAITAANGSAGLVLPTGIIQDSPSSELTGHLMKGLGLASVYDFENRMKNGTGKWFDDAHPQQRFCLYTIRFGQESTRFCFDIDALSEIHDPGRAYSQSYKEVLNFCYGSYKIPMFKNVKDAFLCAKSYRSGVSLHGLMGGDNPSIKTALIFNADADSKSQRRLHIEKGDDDRQLYEGSYIHQFDHRFGTYCEGKVDNVLAMAKNNPAYSIVTEYYLPHYLIASRMILLMNKEPAWTLVLRRQARATDSWISICAIIPGAAAEGSLTAFFVATSIDATGLLCANLNSIMFNYLARLRQSGPNLNKNIYSQLPIIPWDTMIGEQQLSQWVRPRVCELVYTSFDLSHFANDYGFEGPPFRWDEDRRFLLRCELDAAFFHLYLPADLDGSWKKAGGETDTDLAAFQVASPTPRHAVDYIMDTFLIVKRKDEAAYGEYRTKRVILEIYDELQQAMATGKPYKTRLDPPPADPRCCHND